MSKGSSNDYEDESQSWLQKGMATIVRMGRVSGNPARSQEHKNPLHEPFTDLISYLIFFAASCDQAPPSPNDLREKTIALINTQEEQAKTLGVSQENFRDARYAVLAWADELILNSAWPQRMQWQHLMLTYYGTVNAGEDFFRRLDALPAQANDVREIYFLCLALGFQGQYALGSDPRELRELKQRAYKQLSAVNGDIRQNYARLFPEAYQRATLAPPVKRKNKLLCYFTALAVPIILFGFFSFLLWKKKESILASEPPPPPPPQWDSCVKDALTAKKIPAEEATRGVVITLASVLRFQANSPELSPDAQVLINDIVEIVKQCAADRSVIVEGQASKEGNPVLNRELSEKRARNVAEAFARAGFRREKISSWGYGSDRPKPGATDAENRRVEITIVR